MTPRTSVRAESRGMSNVFRVEVIGRRGSFTGIRRTWSEAVATARHYAALFDAPRSVI